MRDTRPPSLPFTPAPAALTRRQLSATGRAATQALTPKRPSMTCTRAPYPPAQTRPRWRAMHEIELAAARSRKLFPDGYQWTKKRRIKVLKRPWPALRSCHQQDRRQVGDLLCGMERTRPCTAPKAFCSPYRQPMKIRADMLPY